MLTRPALLKPEQEKNSTKWHSIKDNFRYLFSPQFFQNIELWYNTVAPVRHRESFRFVIKAIHQQKATPIVNETQQSRTAHMIDLYGMILSNQGREKARSWISAADDSNLERFRDVFTAVQATFQLTSTMKSSYAPTISGTLPTRQLPCLPYIPSREAIDSTSQRFTKPKSQFDGFDVNKALGLTEGEASLEQLKASKLGVTNGTYTIDENGCSIFKACAGNSVEGQSSSFRVVPSFGRGGDWISTSRETLKNYGVTKPERINVEKHPAIARVTASSGLCVPNMKGTLHFSSTM
jgi:hypothetical protein